jgi:drug/metabolite transporter (DMT)-like permease
VDWSSRIIPWNFSHDRRRVVGATDSVRLSCWQLADSIWNSLLGALHCPLSPVALLSKSTKICVLYGRFRYPFVVLVSILSLSNQDFGAVGWVSWAALFSSTTLAVVFSYMVWCTGVQEIGSTGTAMYQNLAPLMAVVAWQVLGEKLFPTQVLGGTLVFLGIYLTRFSKERRQELES